MGQYEDLEISILSSCKRVPIVDSRDLRVCLLREVRDWTP